MKTNDQITIIPLQNLCFSGCDFRIALVLLHKLSYSSERKFVINEHKTSSD